MRERFVELTQEAVDRVSARGLEGAFTMLYLLRFREVADYSAFPELAPDAPISGREAYRRFLAHARPYIEENGGEILLTGEGGSFLIGPPDETWDLVTLIRQRSLATYMAYVTDPGYATGICHWLAGLEDVRLLPMVEMPPS